MKTKSDHKPFEPIHNPYIVGNPIRGSKMFFGREDDFAYIKAKITGNEEGGLIVLCGARRSGKTSILFQIQDGRLGEDFVPVLVDMQSMAIRNDADFLGKVARAIVASPRVGPALRAETAGIDEQEDPFEAFEQFIRRLAGELVQKKLVLTFDEYELFETHFDSGMLTEQVLRLLGNLIEHKNLFVVFTGSDKLEARDKKYWDILSKGQNKRISFLTRKDTLRLVTEPLEGDVFYDEGLPEAIADLTAGQPFYTQVLCQTIVDHLNDQRKCDVTAEDLQRVVDEVIVNPLPQMIFHWNSLSVAEKLCLSVIAEITRHDAKPVRAGDIAAFAEKEGLGYRFDSNALKKALENLFKGDLLVKSAEEDTYTFKMGLWRLWITRMHSMWQVIDEMEREGGIPSELTPVAKSKGRKWAIVAVSLAAAAAISFFTLSSFIGGTNPPSGTLRPAPGDYGGIKIESIPANAEVRVDGARIGWTPVNDSVPVGLHQITVSYTGYRTLVDTLFFFTGAVTAEAYELAEISGSVYVQSDPPGAQIWLNGENTGRMAPDTLTGLSVNSDHAISLVLQGFYRYTFPPVEPLADTTIVITRDLSKKTSPLMIDSRPQGAFYAIDGGKWTGNTPRALSDIEYGRHVVRFTKEGYEDWEQTIDVPYENDEIVATLQLLADGYFEFKITPVADVYLDGTLVRSEISYLVHAARPGKHSVELRLGTNVFTESHDLAPGDTITVEYAWGD